MTWNEFWTNVGNTKLAPAEYLYSLKHIICLIIVVFLCVVLSLVFRKKSQKAKDNLLNVFGFYFLFWEVSTRIVNLINTTDYSLSNILDILLPMHICSVVVWVFIFACFLRKQNMINFSVVCGLLATGSFLLYPATGFVFEDWTFTVIYSVTSHSFGFVCAILLMTLGYAKFDWKRLPILLFGFVVMLSYGAFIDFILFPGSNYMFLVEPPVEILPLLPFQAVYGTLLVLYVLCFFIIYNISKKKKLS